MSKTKYYLEYLRRSNVKDIESILYIENTNGRIGINYTGLTIYDLYV